MVPQTDQLSDLDKQILLHFDMPEDRKALLPKTVQMVSYDYRLRRDWNKGMEPSVLIPNFPSTYQEKTHAERVED
jgi:hypothetical protein